MLRISRRETDPVQIILAAQIQLRRWRRGEMGETPLQSRQRIREIVAARDSLIDSLMNDLLASRRTSSRVACCERRAFATDQADQRVESLSRTV